MHVAVVGLGYVGLVSAAGLARLGHRVRGLDASAQRVAQLQQGALPFHEPGLDDLVADVVADGSLSFHHDPDVALRTADLVIVAVGTYGADGGWDTRAVSDCVAEIGPRMVDTSVLVIRSTLPPDFLTTLTTVLRSSRAAAGRPPIPLVLNPEFTREGSAVREFLAPDRIVIGTLDDPTGSGADRVRQLYMGVEAPLIITSGADACLAKLGSNLFLATKISFANELARICDRYGAQIDNVVEVMGYDARIGRSFLRPGVGFGGSCLPHQVASTVRAFGDDEDPLAVLAGVEAVNLGQRDRLIQLVTSFGDLDRRRVAVLGLTFKPGTDDMRAAPAIPVVRGLLAEGASVVAYDPMPRARDFASDLLPGLEVAESALAALDGADVAVILTEWPEFASLDWALAARRMREPTLVDGRNVVDPAVAKAAGITYTAFGRQLHRGARVPTAAPARVRDGDLIRLHDDEPSQRADAVGAVLATALASPTRVPVIAAVDGARLEDEVAG